VRDLGCSGDLGSAADVDSPAHMRDERGASGRRRRISRARLVSLQVYACVGAPDCRHTIRLCEERSLGPRMSRGAARRSAQLFTSCLRASPRARSTTLLDPGRSSRRARCEADGAAMSLRQADVFRSGNAPTRKRFAASIARLAQSAQSSKPSAMQFIAQKCDPAMKIIAVKTFLVQEKRGREFHLCETRDDKGLPLG